LGRREVFDGQIRHPIAAQKVLAFMRENGIEKMSELRDVVSQKENRASSIHDKLAVLNIRRTAEDVVRDLNRSPQQQQRGVRDRGRDR
jgi:hypothetical protein